MGTEVEYGIAVPGDPTANPVVTSTQVVLSPTPPRRTCPATVGRAGTTRSSRRCATARGFDLSAPSLAPQLDTDLDDLGAANVILTNGARFYVDHAHPEYSTPEVLSPRDVVTWDKAGERIMLEAANRAATVPGAPRMQVCTRTTSTARAPATAPTRTT
ncbi:proteasome accessory factor PafA2 family protein, partial [Pseudonocardia sp. ICBG601]|uniref:proteasome accessory factor PafA2 family protein n=1 Tax=Pseudonocardia sp. ICBG601 TaxID=2846759 RepID=UPI0021F62C43